MTRTHKDNSDMTSGVVRMPKYFGKAGFMHTDPKSTKKNGNGKANWGELGSDDILDEEFNFSHTRRRSNSSSFSHSVRSFKTKFDVNDEPVFEEAVLEDYMALPDDNATVEGDELAMDKQEATESASTVSSEL